MPNGPELIDRGARVRLAAHEIVLHEDVMKAYRTLGPGHAVNDRKLTRVRLRHLKKSTKTTVQCTAQTRRGMGRRCRLRTTLYPKTCWLHTQMYQGVKVVRSQIKDGGLGVMTLKELSSNHTIGEYDGAIIPHGEASTSEYMAQEPDAADGTAGRIRNAINSQHNIVRLINDCKDDSKRDADGNARCEDENCEMEMNVRNDRIIVSTTKAIAKNEELFLSYGAAFWNDAVVTAKVKRTRKPKAWTRVGVANTLVKTRENNEARRAKRRAEADEGEG